MYTCQQLLLSFTWFERCMYDDILNKLYTKYCFLNPYHYCFMSQLHDMYTDITMFYMRYVYHNERGRNQKINAL